MRAREYRTPVKTRILAGGVHAARQQVVRIDREAGWPLDEAVSAALAKKIEPALDGCDAVLLSDYGSGLVTPALAGTVRRVLARRGRRRPIPVLLDSRYRLLDYRGLAACTPNESEVEQVLGVRIGDDRGGAREGRGGCCCGAPACKRCSSPGAAAAWRCFNRGSRPCTSRSSVPMK